jgi:V/A-type H+-transporting ATPase subunit B
MRAELTVSGAATAIEGPLLFLNRTVEVGLNEAVEVVDETGATRLGRIAALDEASIVVEVLESTTGLGLKGVRVRFLGAPIQVSLGPGLLGRIFNGVGQPADGGPPVMAKARLRIDGRSMNPAERELPRDFNETGVTAIDLMNSDRKSTRLNSSHNPASRMPSSA